MSLAAIREYKRIEDWAHGQKNWNEIQNSQYVIFRQNKEEEKEQDEINEENEINNHNREIEREGIRRTRYLQRRRMRSLSPNYQDPVPKKQITNILPNPNEYQFNNKYGKYEMIMQRIEDLDRKKKNDELEIWRQKRQKRKFNQRRKMENVMSVNTRKDNYNISEETSHSSSPSLSLSITPPHTPYNTTIQNRVTNNNQINNQRSRNKFRRTQINQKRINGQQSKDQFDIQQYGSRK